MKKTVLREYAKLIVRCGINVQKGQDVLVFADLDQPEFVAMVVDEAYKAKLAGVGEKYGKTAAQTILRFLVQSDVVVIPKSSRKERACASGRSFMDVLRTFFEKH